MFKYRVYLVLVYHRIIWRTILTPKMKNISLLQLLQRSKGHLWSWSKNKRHIQLKKMQLRISLASKKAILSKSKKLRQLKKMQLRISLASKKAILSKSQKLRQLKKMQLRISLASKKAIQSKSKKHSQLIKMQLRISFSSKKVMLSVSILAHTSWPWLSSVLERQKYELLTINRRLCALPSVMATSVPWVHKLIINFAQTLPAPWPISRAFWEPMQFRFVIMRTKRSTSSTVLTLIRKV